MIGEEGRRFSAQSESPARRLGELSAVNAGDARPVSVLAAQSTGNAAEPVRGGFLQGALPESEPNSAATFGPLRPTAGLELLSRALEQLQPHAVAACIDDLVSSALADLRRADFREALDGPVLAALQSGGFAEGVVLREEAIRQFVQEPRNCRLFLEIARRAAGEE